MRPTLDPLTLTPLRNAVIHSAWGRGKIDLPPGIAKKLSDTPVFVGGDIRESRFQEGPGEVDARRTCFRQGQESKVQG